MASAQMPYARHGSRGFLMVYQILGWPRSRTAWLANFLTWDNSFCFHEGVGDFKNKRMLSVMQYRKLFSKFLQHFKHVGDSNTYSLMHQKFVLPEAKVVIIERSAEEVEKAVAKLGIAVKIPEVIEYPYNECLRIQYDDIDERLGEIWEFCMPGVKRNLPREHLLKKLNIQVTDPYAYMNFKGV